MRKIAWSRIKLPKIKWPRIKRPRIDFERRLRAARTLWVSRRELFRIWARTAPHPISFFRHRDGIPIQDAAILACVVLEGTNWMEHAHATSLAPYKEFGLSHSTYVRHYFIQMIALKCMLCGRWETSRSYCWFRGSGFKITPGENIMQGTSNVDGPHSPRYVDVYVRRSVLRKFLKWAKSERYDLWVHGGRHSGDMIH